MRDPERRYCSLPWEANSLPVIIHAPQKDPDRRSLRRIPPSCGMLTAAEAAAAVLPYDILDIPGRHPVTDLVSNLFFLYPFVLAFAVAILYDVLSPALPGDVVR